MSEQVSLDAVAAGFVEQVASRFGVRAIVVMGNQRRVDVASSETPKRATEDLAVAIHLMIEQLIRSRGHDLVDMCRHPDQYSEELVSSLELIDALRGAGVLAESMVVMLKSAVCMAESDAVVTRLRTDPLLN